MNGDNRRAKLAFVLALFAVIMLLTYFWPVPIHAADLRNLTPGFLRGDIDSYMDTLSPEQQAALLVPPPEIPIELNTTLKDLVVTQGELNATSWISASTNDSDKFMADIWGAELIMGMTTRKSTVGGDWANAPDPVRLMTDTDEFYRTTDPGKAYDLARGLNATYAFVPEHRRLNAGWWLKPEDVGREKFSDARYFELVYRNEDVSIYKIL